LLPLTAADLRGVWGSLLLPLRSDDSIDLRLLTDQVDTLVSSGLHGLYAHGTAGEFQTLTEPEFDQVNEILAAACTTVGVPFQIGASHPSAQVMAERVKRAVRLEPGAVQVILPDWLPLNDDEVMSFLTRVASLAAPVPLVLYNPPHAKTIVRPDLFARLAAAVPTLIGTKTAGGDHAWYDAMRPTGLANFVPGHLLATAMTLGAHGSYSNVAALSPAGAVWWWQLMQEDPAAALDVERRIAEFFAGHIAPLQTAGLSNPALDKFLAAVGDWSELATRTRWPTSFATDEAVKAARPAVRELLPELFPGT